MEFNDFYEDNKKLYNKIKDYIEQKFSELIVINALCGIDNKLEILENKYAVYGISITQQNNCLRFYCRCDEDLSEIFKSVFKNTSIYNINYNMSSYFNSYDDIDIKKLYSLINMYYNIVLEICTEY